MSKHTFLVEIGTEELPPKELRNLAEAFALHIKLEFNIANIQYRELNWFATPRRLAIQVDELDNVQSDSTIEYRGPSVSQAFDAYGKPTTAAKKWANNCNITLAQANINVNKKGQWLLYRTKIRGHPIRSLLCNIVNKALNKIPTKKLMRWGDGRVQFVRPVNNVTMLLDNKLLPGKMFGIDINRTLLGHRFMGKQTIILNHAKQYSQILLSQGYVIADYLKRKKKIQLNVEIAAQKLGGIADISDSLLEEITSMVEWPVVLTANFKKKFLSIPLEVLIHIITKDQKYFPIYDHAGNLMPYFIFVANIESKNPQQIISSNEKIMHAKLTDAEYFFNADLKQRLEDRLPLLNGVLFQKQLGTLLEKSYRVEALSAWIANRIGANVTQSARAGLLSKCDLVTNMVFEFSSVQGVLGMHYARHDGEPENVAIAQKEQYYPRFAGDILPTTLESCAVAISDKIDTLVGIFGISQFPKGNKDPFALKRAAIGVLRIIIEKKLPLDLQALMQKAICLYKGKIVNNSVTEDIINLIMNRLYAWYHNKGYSHDVVQAVLTLRPTKLSDCDARVQALNCFCKTKAATALLTANKRSLNILSKANIPTNVKLQLSLLKEPAEITLANHLALLREKLQPMLESRDYENALIELTSLSSIVDNFFNSVMVVTDNYHLRTNRLVLLAQMRDLVLQIADISLLK